MIHPPMAAEIGTRIRSARRDRQLSQAALGREIDRTALTVSRWELGHTCPGLELLPELVDALGISLDYLLRGQDAA